MTRAPQTAIRAGSRLSLQSAALLLAAWVGIALPGTVRGDFMVSHTGHTVFGSNGAGGLGDPGGDGHVSFAVYQNTSGDWTNALGLTGSAVSLAPGTSLTSGARYVYFYQIVNTDPIQNGLDSALTSLTLRGAADLATSVGYLHGQVFNDIGIQGGSAVSQGPVTGANVNLSINTSDPDTLDDGIPSASGFDFTDVAFTDGAGQRPDSYLKESGDLRFNFQDLTDVMGMNLGDFRIAPGAFSTVMFFTSDAGPGYRFSILENSADTQADLPVPVPEPSSLWVMLITGLPLAAISAMSWFRRSKKIANP